MRTTLPPSLPPRGLSRERAAELVGVSASTFDKMVADGVMPPPKIVYRRRLWDRIRLEEAFAALPEEAETGQNAPTSTWDELLNGHH